MGRNKAIVAIARKLLIAVWNVISKQATDRYADPQMVARKLMQFTYQITKHNRPADQSSAQFVRQQLDLRQLGADLQEIPLSAKKKPLPLPPSALLQKK